jgi:hypothetical protein
MVVLLLGIVVIAFSSLPQPIVTADAEFHFHIGNPPQADGDRPRHNIHQTVFQRAKPVAR